MSGLTVGMAGQGRLDARPTDWDLGIAKAEAIEESGNGN
jgi:hypothetical protein